ncbi:hypothetical protein AB0H49_23325 [Nocardia sp. NPDC050713]|uniref:hypothetical protein n=1 Tax=Nocardia sp. NPDC050713 TaxID=3154511 RepID=UPI0033EEDE9B
MTSDRRAATETCPRPSVQLLSNLDECWASGFPRDIHFHNRSARNFLVFSSNDCTGEPIATVAPGAVATFYGWSAKAAP